MTGDRVRRDGARWGVRTIRPGARVRWCGRWFRLDDRPANVSVSEYEKLSPKERGRPEADPDCKRPAYDGRLDGLKGLFFTYGQHHERSKNHVWLHSIVGVEWPGPACVGGYFVWDTFKLEDA